MTARTRASLKSEFEQGDRPQGTNYEDLIDSFPTIADTTAQSLASPLSVTGAFGASTTVSAVSIEASAGVFTTVSANAIEASSASFTIVSAVTIAGGFIGGDTAQLTGTVSASAGNFEVLVVGGEQIVPSTQRAAVEVYIEATALVTCSSTAVFTAISVSASSGGFTPVDFSAHSTEVKVTYTGTFEKNFLATTYISSKLNTGTNDNIQYVILKNGTALNRTRISRFIANATDFGSISTGCIVDMSATDTLSVGLRNTTDVVNVDVGNCILIVSEV